jgi:hypothetical protein
MVIRVFLSNFNPIPSICWSVAERCDHVKQSLDRPIGFQEVQDPRFQENRYMKVVRLPALRTDRFYPPSPLRPQKLFLVLISVWIWVNPKIILRPERLCQWKIPVTLRNRTRDLPACNTVSLKYFYQYDIIIINIISHHHDYTGAFCTWRS